MKYIFLLQNTLYIISTGYKSKLIRLNLLSELTYSCINSLCLIVMFINSVYSFFLHNLV
jgi:hypothetical protein